MGNYFDKAIAPCKHSQVTHILYWVATMSMRLKMTSLFCRISSLLYGSFANETYNFKEPTNRCHPITRDNIHVKSMAFGNTPRRMNKRVMADISTSLRQYATHAYE